MKKLIRAIGLLSLSTGVLFTAGCQQETGLQRADAVPETDVQKESYAIGRNMGMNLSQAEIEFDQAYFNAGFYDAIEGEQRMTDEEVMQALTALQQKTMAKQQAKMAESLQANLQAAEAFLAENANKEGVVALESGLQYKVITAAEGANPSAEDVVTVHYEGRLVDGTVFDSSYQRGEPTSFPLNGVISGWTEALQLMSPGEKWELYVPPALAYGERAVGEHIQPNSLLIFNVELLSIGEDSAQEGG